MLDILEKIEKKNSLKNFAYIKGDKKFTYLDLSIRIHLIKEAIISNNIKNNRIGIFLSQGLDYGASLVSIPLSNNVGVLLTKKWKKFEILNAIKSSDVNYIISDNQNVDGVESKIIASFDNLYLLYLKNQGKIKLSKDNDAIIIFSSGTTGSSKGVVLTKKSLSNNVKSVSKYLNLNHKDISLIYTPTCYAFSLSQTLTHFYSSATLVPFDKIIFPYEIIKNILKNKITGVTGPPASFELLCNITKKKLQSVRYAQVGGTPFSIDLAKKIRKNFPAAKILNVYGCSENSPRVSYFYLNNRNLNYGLDDQGYYCIGKNVDGTNIKIMTKKNSSVGEILIKGTSLMDRYWNNPTLTKKKFINKYFRTGDIGFFNKKNLYLVGRKDFIINVGNEKVSPEEVENVINNNNNIKSSVIYKKRDKILGSSVISDIVVKKKISKVKIIDFLKQHISEYKIPKEINFVKKIRKNLYGKIDRKYYAKKYS